MSNIDCPKHYTHGIQPLDVIDSWKLDYYLGNVVKYICRHNYKGKPLEDLKKAQCYLNRKIKLMEEE